MASHWELSVGVLYKYGGGRRAEDQNFTPLLLYIKNWTFMNSGVSQRKKKGDAYAATVNTDSLIGWTDLQHCVSARLPYALHVLLVKGVYRQLRRTRIVLTDDHGFAGPIKCFLVGIDHSADPKPGSRSPIFEYC